MLEAGQIDLGRVRAVAETTAALSSEQAGAVERKVLARGGRASPSLFRQALRRAVLSADPDGARRRHAHARKGRQVQLHPAEDGMAELWALLPAVDAQAAYQRLDALARAVTGPEASSGVDALPDMGARRAVDGPDEPPSMDARRADVLVDLLLGRDRGGQVSVEVEVGVLVSAATLAGVSDTPGELAGYGPLPADIVRELAREATWRRILTDPAQGDRPVEVGRRFPAPGLARLLRTREQVCRFPGCRKPARFCDLDHIQPHSAGGPTSEKNMLALCRRHHRAKHEGGWTVQRAGGDTAVWASPTGRTYFDIPEPWDEPTRPGAGERSRTGEEEGACPAPRRTVVTIPASSSDCRAGGQSRAGAHDPTTAGTGHSSIPDLGPPPF